MIVLNEATGLWETEGPEGVLRARTRKEAAAARAAALARKEAAADFEPGPDGAYKPKGVELIDPDDVPTRRRLVFDAVKREMEKSFPAERGGVRLEADKLEWADPEEIDPDEQKKVLLRGGTLARRLRGTLRLRDQEGKVLDEKRVTLLRVPYMTGEGTFVHGGNDYTVASQSRLVPGVFTRVRKNGQLETQFNVRAGTGRQTRVSFEPRTMQYKVRVGGANLHLYSLLRELGYGDGQLAERWGTTVLDANAGKRDSRVLDKAWRKLVPSWKREENADEDVKREQVREALNRAELHATTAKLNLPNMFSRAKAAAWRGAALENARAGLRAALRGRPEPEVMLELLKKARKEKEPEGRREFVADMGEEEYVPMGADGLLSASEKLLAVNQGVAEPDVRDVMANERVYMPHDIMAERVRLDHGHARRKLLSRVARAGNLNGVAPYAFDDYTVGMFRDHPLAQPIEGLNPMQILDQLRRVSKMGPGGVGDPNAVTAGMQAVHPSQFGFIDVLSGPESELAGLDTRLAWRARLGSDRRVYQLVRDRKLGKRRWVSAEDLRHATLKLPE